MFQSKNHFFLRKKFFCVQNMSPLGQSMELEPVSLKGRLRKPSAKALAAAESVSAPSGSQPVTPSRSSTRQQRQSVLSFQFAVAESVVNDDEEDNQLDAREKAITIETIPMNEWRSKGFMRAVGRIPVAAEPEPVHVSVAETTGSEAGGSEELMSPKQALADEPDMDPHSEEQQVEVKRKRGRPFKGQEKPIEERLMIETCKIRRLIDDVIRKGDSSEFFTRLRKIASDLDSVITLMPSGERSEHILPNPPVKEEEEPITASEPQEEENTSNE